MQIPRPTNEAKQRFRDLVPTDPRVVIKPMFGNLGAFVQGNMFMGLFGSDVGVNLSATDQAEVRAAGGSSFGPAERPMGGYVTLPASASVAQLHAWIAASLNYVALQPPKRPKAAKR